MQAETLSLWARAKVSGCEEEGRSLSVIVVQTFEAKVTAYRTYLICRPKLYSARGCSHLTDLTSETTASLTAQRLCVLRNVFSSLMVAVCCCGVRSIRALRAQQRPRTTTRYLRRFGHIGLVCVCMLRPASCLYCDCVCSCLCHCIVLVLSRCILWLRPSGISSPVCVFRMHHLIESFCLINAEPEHIAPEPVRRLRSRTLSTSAQIYLSISLSSCLLCLPLGSTLLYSH